MRRKNWPRISGREVRKIRKAMGFTQEEFARFLWVTYSTLNRWEANRAEPFGMHLRILMLLRREIGRPSFRALLQNPRSAGAEAQV